MKRKPHSRRKRTSTKSVLRLPDLEHAKTAVLNSLNSADAKRGYRHAIDEFVDWYCSEPCLAFNRIVVLRYRSHLESRQLAPGNAASIWPRPWRTVIPRSSSKPRIWLMTAVRRITQRSRTRCKDCRSSCFVALVRY